MKSMREAKGEKGVVALARDNWQFGDWGLLCDGHYVWISLQAEGEMPERKIEIPKNVFDRMVDAYIAPQMPTKKTA